MEPASPLLPPDSARNRRRERPSIPVAEHATITVGIASYNGRRLLEVLLPSLAAQSFRDFRVVVVDDASEDDTVAWLAEHWPAVDVIALAANVGVTRALNRCLTADRAPFACLLNNDLELHPDCLRELLRTLAERPAAGVATAKLIDFARRDIFDGAGDFYTWGGEANRRGQGEPDHGQYDTACETFSACGAVALYRREALERVGIFDEGLYAIYEDVDWSFRARLAGYGTRYVPSAVAYHMGSATLGRGLNDFTLYHNWRNAIWVVVKNYPAAALVRHAPDLAFVQLRNLAIAVRRGRFELWLRAWRDALRGLPAVIGKRRAVQRTRRVGLSELERWIGRDR